MSLTPALQNQSQKGLGYAITAYLLWGMAPVFFKFLDEVPTYEIIAHRIIWSLALLIIFITFNQSWSQVLRITKQPKVLLQLMFSSILVCTNWTIYVWAINHEHVLETSLGYFICPLSSILLGIIFLKERFRALQWTALVLAALGILVQIWFFGTVPIIALSIALTFSLYGFARKLIGVGPMAGLFFETLWLFPFALIYLLFFTDGSITSNLFNNRLNLNLLLAASGAMTTIPLILFNAAAIRIKLSTLGILQYFGPTLAFLLAIFVYHEPIGWDKWITFIFIWAGLLLFIWDSIMHGSKKTLAKKSSSN
ncbi:MAG: EamA family transporter RarD [Saezia sp.]